HDRVLVSPAPGQPGKMPFWRGDAAGRPLDLGRRIGAMIRELRAAPPDVALARPTRQHELDVLAAQNLLKYLDDPALATRAVPDLGSTAVVAARFREGAARALLLPKRRPGGRAPLWQQRKRAADLLAVAAQYGSFPMLLETYRECLRDVFDMPALVETLAAVRDGRIEAVTVDTDVPSPFAASLLFGYVANFIYEGDAPLAERRAQALS